MGQHHTSTAEGMPIQAPLPHTERFAEITQLTDRERDLFLGALTTVTYVQAEGSYPFFQAVDSEFRQTLQRPWFNPALQK